MGDRDGAGDRGDTEDGGEGDAEDLELHVDSLGDERWVARQDATRAWRLPALLLFSRGAAQVPECGQQRLARRGIRRRLGRLVHRRDEPAHVLEVALAAVALGEVRLEAGALGLGQRALEVV